jgi:hypothetical protein
MSAHDDDEDDEIQTTVGRRMLGQAARQSRRSPASWCPILSTPLAGATTT